MSLTPSTMLPLGTPLPAFDVRDLTTRQTLVPKSFADNPALLVMFICQHCPYVQHVKTELASLAKDYSPKGVGILAISSNDAAAYPDDAPEELRLFAQREGFNFPFAYDETQGIAKAFTAACTPDFFLFDKSRTLVYRGQLDDSRPGNGKPVTGKDLRAAIDALLAGRPIDGNQKPSMGCNIKWKRGHEPDYFR